MKILFAIKALDDTQGGAERVLADITSGLVNRGHTVAVMSFDQPGGKPFYPLDKKVKRIPLGIGNVKRKATFPEIISRMTAIRKAALKMQPDVVIAFMHSTFIPASFAMKGTGVPIIASEHIVPHHYKNRRWEYILLILSRFFVKKITVLSQCIIDSYPSILRSKMVAIANPVKPADELANPADKECNKKIILNVGRLTDQKDQETLIKSFSNIAKDFPEWNLRIIGKGELRPKLEELVISLKMQDRISLPGVTSKIKEEYQAAHIFALTSKYESFGLATAEAMAHGLPTIGFAGCPGTNELIINEKNGLLIKVEGNNKVQAFSKGLACLMNDSDLRKNLGLNGLKTIDQFHPDKIVTQWENLVKNL